MKNKVKDKKDDMSECLKLVAPGTDLREGLENIVRANTGALIVASDNKEVMDMVDGGFKIDSEYGPAKIYELSKMDGAIILSEDLKKILYANAQLMPESNIDSQETGTRHRTAERVAKQTGRLVISISQRRNLITLYKHSEKYVLKDANEILNKANQALQTLEKYRAVLDNAVSSLNGLEFENIVVTFDMAKVIQRTEMLMRIVKEIEKYILELGNEGRLIEMQLDELKEFVETDGMNIIKDYAILVKKETYKDIKRKLEKLNSDEILDLSNILMILGYTDENCDLELGVVPKGYRVLSKIPRIPTVVIENAIKMFNNLPNILEASTEELDHVEGIGEVRARIIKNELKRFIDNSLIDRHL